MEKREEEFIELSAILTWFTRTELLGTAMIHEYLGTLDAALPAGVLNELLAVYEQLPADAGERDGEVEERIFNDPKLAPVAQSLILLWYCGSWTALPDDWYATYGSAPKKISGVVSGQAYQAGLQWTVIGSHAPGSSQQGFGSWTVLPQRRIL